MGNWRWRSHQHNARRDRVRELEETELREEEACETTEETAFRQQVETELETAEVMR